MFTFLTPHHPFASQTLRLAAEASQGGGDVFEIARCCERIELGDKDSWEREWIALAEKTEVWAQEALDSGHPVSARNYFFHANNYWRMADVFLLGFDPRRAHYFSKAQECFREAVKLNGPKSEIIEVKCGDEVYDGYFFLPPDPKTEKVPAVFLIGGADAYAEEIYFSGRQVLDRGWALLLVDTPGRGSSIYLKGIKTRPDYEVPTAACIDWLTARPEVDENRIGLMGISLAGYYAPRAACYEERIKALVGWSGCYNILEDVYEHCAHLQPTLQRLLGGVDDETARAELKSFVVQDADKIKIPTLISHGTTDTLMSVEGAKKLFEGISSDDKTLNLIDGSDNGGGSMHCSHDYWARNVPTMLDWLEDRI